MQSRPGGTYFTPALIRPPLGLAPSLRLGVVRGCGVLPELCRVVTPVRRQRVWRDKSPDSRKTMCSVEVDNNGEKKISNLQCVMVIVVPEGLCKTRRPKDAQKSCWYRC